MLKKSTIQLLRFPFSFFLLPVYLFALSQLPSFDSAKAIVVFIILHVLVYPSSNGYNSYMDKDTEAIGGLPYPLAPTRELFYITVVMDAMAILLSIGVGTVMVTGVSLYIIASRMYSYRGIRLKKFPVIGFLTVFICQGALVFFMVYMSCGHMKSIPWVAMLCASCLIGSYYPLTQIYQHRQDAEDGVMSISMMLGKKGSFIFSGCLFLMSSICLAWLSYQQMHPEYFWYFLIFMLPVLVYFLHWMNQVWQDEKKADFKNSFQMNIIASACTIFYFLMLNAFQYFE